MSLLTKQSHFQYKDKDYPLKCINAAFIVLKDQLSTNKLKVNGDKALKESRMEYRETRNKDVEYYSVAT